MFCDQCRVLTVIHEVVARGAGLTLEERAPANGIFGLFEHSGLKGWRYGPLDYGVTDHFPNLPVLFASAREGCSFCSRLRQALQSKEFALVSRDERHRSGYVYIEMSIWMKGSPGYDNSDPVISFLEVTVKMTGNWHRILFPIEAIGESSVSSTYGKDYLSQANRDWMLKAVLECEHHSHASIDPCFLPTRLVDVREEHLKLTTRDDILNFLPNGNSRPKYTALSYVWGSPEEARRQLKTDSNSLIQRCTRINEDDLTSAIRDAVRVTRALSIPYLWVDALCILQDTSENKDWERECAVMDRIYGNATLTICAATSRSCDDGFLARPTWIRPLEIGFKLPGNPPTSYATYRLQAFVVDSQQQYLPASLEECNLWESPWCNRGWTFQETVLSTRSLTFGWLGLTFRCPTSHQAQYSAYNPGLSSFQIGRYLHSTRLSEQEILKQSELYEAWAVYVLPTYSLRRGESGLTRSTDCLPALAGLAAKFSQLLSVLESDYVAGLWRQDLFRSLIWTMISEHDASPPEFDDLMEHLEHKPVIAPSWSWASWAMAHFGYRHSVWRPGKVEVLGYTLRSLAPLRPESDIVACVVPNRGNPFGEISSGVLRVTTKMRALPSSPLIREEKLIGRANIISEGPRIVYLNHRYFATCMFDWSDGLGGIMQKWSEAYLRRPYSRVRMLLLGSGELILDNPEMTSNKQDGSEGLQESPPRATEALDVEWKDRETELPEDAIYKEDRCAVGLLVMQDSSALGKYYRVGVFVSEPRGYGGLQAFQSLQDTTIELI